MVWKDPTKSQSRSSNHHVFLSEKVLFLFLVSFSFPLEKNQQKTQHHTSFSFKHWHWLDLGWKNCIWRFWPLCTPSSWRLCNCQMWRLVWLWLWSWWTNVPLGSWGRLGVIQWFLAGVIKLPIFFWGGSFAMQTYGDFQGFPLFGLVIWWPLLKIYIYAFRQQIASENRIAWELPDILELLALLKVVVTGETLLVPRSTFHQFVLITLATKMKLPILDQFFGSPWGSNLKFDSSHFYRCICKW